jgi:hypothetical protein
VIKRKLHDRFLEPVVRQMSCLNLDKLRGKKVLHRCFVLTSYLPESVLERHFMPYAGSARGVATAAAVASSQRRRPLGIDSQPSIASSMDVIRFEIYPFIG